LLFFPGNFFQAIAALLAVELIFSPGHVLHFLQGTCCHARSLKNQHVCVDAAATSHFCGDVLPWFLEGSDVLIFFNPALLFG